MFIRVDPQHAGASALGVLIPHGAKTLVIVRPRALAWDLLPARWDGDSSHPPQFCVFTRDEAATVARRFITSLESVIERGNDPLESFGDAERAHVQLWLRTDEFIWIVCQRAQGAAYKPIIFASQEDATIAAQELAVHVCPANEAKQEYYFNTQNLS